MISRQCWSRCIEGRRLICHWRTNCLSFHQHTRQSLSFISSATSLHSESRSPIGWQFDYLFLSFCHSLSVNQWKHKTSFPRDKNKEPKLPQCFWTWLFGRQREALLYTSLVLQCSVFHCPPSFRSNFSEYDSVFQCSSSHSLTDLVLR